MNKKELLGARIKELRKIKGLSQEGLAEKVDISPNYLGRIERGKENPTLDMLLRLAEALGVELWEICDFGHQMTIKDIKETLHRLVKEADEERLRLLIKIVMAVVR